MISSQVEPSCSKLELRLLEKLDADGVEYVIHPRVRVELFGKRRRLTPDVLVPSQNLLIEVYGCFVHCCPECGHGDELKNWRDQVRLDALRRAGYEVSVVWEHELAA